jgi:hypothetical protein
MLMAVSSGAFACPFAASPTVDDFTNLREDVVAFKGEILNIVRNGPRRAFPHDGFTVDFRVTENIQGAPGETLSIKFGPCHIPLERVGQIVSIISYKNKVGEYLAPQFPSSMRKRSERPSAQ